MGWIDSISVDGLMKIKFNDSLNLNLSSPFESKKRLLAESNDTQNLSWLNDSVITMFIEPERNWHLEEENFDMKVFNFTFKCLKFYNSTLFGI